LDAGEEKYVIPSGIGLLKTNRYRRGFIYENSTTLNGQDEHQAGVIDRGYSPAEW